VLIVLDLLARQRLVFSNSRHTLAAFFTISKKRFTFTTFTGLLRKRWKINVAIEKHWEYVVIRFAFHELALSSHSQS